MAFSSISSPSSSGLPGSRRCKLPPLGRAREQGQTEQKSGPRSTESVPRSSNTQENALSGVLQHSGENTFDHFCSPRRAAFRDVWNLVPRKYLIVSLLGLMEFPTPCIQMRMGTLDKRHHLPVTIYSKSPSAALKGSVAGGYKKVIPCCRGVSLKEFVLL